MSKVCKKTNAKQTNGDRIRGMTNEELAKELVTPYIDYCTHEVMYKSRLEYGGGGCSYERKEAAIQATLSWLEQEVEDRTMSIKEFAKMLDGRERDYPLFTKDEIMIAEENGFVIVYGASDDLIEFEGTFRDEGSCFDGGKVYFNFDGGEVYFNNERVSQDGTVLENMIEALWCDINARDSNGDIITWTYKTDIPHETFMIYEDGEPYCRGIVFSISDVK